jgi:hypothetical protein
MSDSNWVNPEPITDPAIPPCLDLYRAISALEVIDAGGVEFSIIRGAKSG